MALDAKPVDEITGSIYRDRSGRKRTDLHVSGPDGPTAKITAIWDAVAGKFYAFSDLSPVVETADFTVPHAGEGVLPPLQEVELVNSLPCRVIRIQGYAAADITVWASDDLRHPVRQETRSSEHVTVWELLDPVEGDPDPSVFMLDDRHA